MQQCLEREKPEREKESEIQAGKMLQKSGLDRRGMKGEGRTGVVAVHLVSTSTPLNVAGVRKPANNLHPLPLYFVMGIIGERVRSVKLHSFVLPPRTCPARRKTHPTSGKRAENERA